MTVTRVVRMKVVKFGIYLEGKANRTCRRVGYGRGCGIRAPVKKREKKHVMLFTKMSKPGKANFKEI